MILSTIKEGSECYRVLNLINVNSLREKQQIRERCDVWGAVSSHSLKQRAVRAGMDRKVETEVGVSTQLDLTKPLLHNEDVSSLCIQNVPCMTFI